MSISVTELAVEVDSRVALAGEGERRAVPEFRVAGLRLLCADLDGVFLEAGIEKVY